MFWYLENKNGGDYQFKEKGGSIEWEEDVSSERSKGEAENDYIEGSIFGHADAVKEQNVRSQFVRKNFQRQGRFDPEEGGFEFSLSAEKVKQMHKVKDQGINVGNKMLQLSRSVDKIKAERNTNHGKEPEPRLSIIPYTNNTIPHTASRMSSEKGNSSDGLYVSNDVTLTPNSTKANRIWESFIPGYNNISTGSDMSNETKIMSTTTKATTNDNKVSKTFNVEKYNIKDHMNDSSRFVGFQNEKN